MSDSTRAGATIAGPNSRAAPKIGRRVLGIKDWNEVCDFIYGLDDHWLEELLQERKRQWLDDHWLEELLQERKRQRSRGQWNTGGPIATAADEDSRTTQSYDTAEKWS